MADNIESILQQLPEDLRPAAQQLWERSSVITKDVTDTLAASFALLQHLKSQPQRAEEEQITAALRHELEMAKQDIGRAYPAVTQSWGGQGATVFADYVPQLLDAIESCKDNVENVSAAISMFHDSVSALWTAVIERTRHTTAEVVATVALGGNHAFLSAAPVMDVIEEYADYIEELTKTLLELTSDKHAAGTMLAEAGAAPNGWVIGPDGQPRLPHLSQVANESDGWQPGARVEADTAAMTQLSSTFSSNGQYWQRAVDHSQRISDELAKPEHFGLAGVHFGNDLHEILERDRGMYATVGGHLQHMADTLRAVASDYARVDDEVATHLRKPLDDVE